MQKIADLMKGKTPGEIKICQTYWGKNRWFQPYYEIAHGVWCGKTDSRGHESWSDSQSWQLWQEPVEEIEVFEWMFKPKGDSGWVIFDGLMTDEEAEKYFMDGDQRRKTGRSWKVPR